ncbi:MAG TPA: inositol monophosphatase family protein [Patescibacteria group bacterium]|nr:inositol monophosphatase family protein [Patescibacteria group bacterium]
MRPDPSSLLPETESIARRAGAVIMQFYTGKLDAHCEIKKDGSPVTDADKCAEAIILPALAALTPDIPIVSEEAYERGEIPDVSKGTFWTVDPLDGTKEFTGKTGAFVVALSLVVDGKPVLGVIYHPAFDLMYSAAGPGTAEKTDAEGNRTRLKADSIKTDDVRVVLNEPSTDMLPVKGYLSQQFGDAAKIDPKPGILRAMQVAENNADVSVIYPLKRDGRTKWWDVAPGHAIVEAAGGKVTGVDGKEIRYDAPDFQVPPVISISPRQVAQRAQGQDPRPKTP